MKNLEHPDQDNHFREFMKQQLNSETPPKIIASAEEQLARFRSEHSAESHESKATNRRDRSSRRTREFAWKWPVWIGIPVGLVVLFAIFFSTQLDQGTAYGQAVDALRNARTLSMRVIELVGQGNLPLESSEVPRDLEAVTTAGGVVSTFTYKDPGLFRYETAQANETTVSLFDYTSERGIRIQNRAKTFMEMNLNLMPQRSRLGDPIDKLRSLPPHPEATVGERTLDGKTVIGHQVEWDGETAILWLDSETDEIVEIHTQRTGQPGTLTIYTKIQFNPDVDDSLFSLEPPPGFSKQLNALETIQQRLDKARAEPNENETAVPLVAIAITLWTNEKTDEALDLLTRKDSGQPPFIEVLPALRTRESDLPRLAPDKLQAIQSEFILVARATKEMCRALRIRIDQEEAENRVENAVEWRKIHKGIGRELMKPEYAAMINLVGEAIFKHEFD